jgi:hypothetical protein
LFILTREDALGVCKLVDEVVVEAAGDVLKLVVVVELVELVVLNDDDDAVVRIEF